MFIPNAGLMAAKARGGKESGEKIEYRQDSMCRTEAMQKTIEVQKKIIEMQKKEIGIYQDFLVELGAEITEGWKKADRFISPVDGKFREYEPKLVHVYLDRHFALDTPSLYSELLRLDKKLNEERW